MADQRDAPPDPDWTDSEAEGIPPLEDQPPGIDAETASEGRFPPRDEPIAVNESEVTPAGERVPETVAKRAARERPDVMGRFETERGRLVDGSEDVAEGEWRDDATGLSAEEDAVHVSEL